MRFGVFQGDFHKTQRYFSKKLWKMLAACRLFVTAECRVES
jgi:hypothetical protein